MERQRTHGMKERGDEDGGRWSGGKVRAVTEVEIEREGRGNSTESCRGKRMTVLRQDKDGAERSRGISFVSHDTNALV